jgi:mevalonate kinase
LSNTKSNIEANAERSAVAAFTRDFETRVPGKWVLCGEHAVLRGASAIALPHPEFSLSLRFRPANGGLTIFPENSRDVVQSILTERGPLPRGELQLETSIPIGAGLGSSAALCVALARWFAPRASPQEIARAATELEHRFHGRSSGMDAAVIAEGQPIRFTRGASAEILQIPRLPRFTFHDTGRRADTRDCVARVEEYRRKFPTEGARWDESMAEASRLAYEGLMSGDLGSISRAMRLAHDCFAAWSLVPPEAQEIQARLAREGALASKLTGAGGGGFVVALWD